jgi:ketosteroid isomerase-like protein
MDHSTARTAIEEGGRKLAAALSQGKFAEIAALYTDDGMVMPPDGNAVSGRSGIEAFWKAAYEALAIRSATLRTLEVYSAEDIATEVGEASLVLESGTAKVKFIVFWQRGPAGVWRLHRDIWNGTP